MVKDDSMADVLSSRSPPKIIAGVVKKSKAEERERGSSAGKEKLGFSRSILPEKALF